MTNPKCAVCGHINRTGAAACEMCDTRLGGPAGAGAGGNFGSTVGTSGPPFGRPGGEPRAGALPTDIPSPQFQGAGDVISPTLEVYRKHFLLVGILVAVTTLPVALLQYVVMQAMLPGDGDPVPVTEFGLFAFSSATSLFVGLLSLVGTALLSGSLVYAVFELQRAGAAAAGESLRRGLRVLPKVFLVSLLYTVITSVGYLLLIIPGVIFSLMLAVAVPVAVAENRGPVEALKRSAALTAGYRGLIFLTYFLWGLLILVINLVVTGSFAYGGAEEMLPALLVQAVVGGMLASSSTVLTVYIFLGILQERRQGFETRSFTPGPEPAAR